MSKKKAEDLDESDLPQEAGPDAGVEYAPEPETPPTTVFDPKTGAHRAPIEGETIRHGRIVHADYTDESAPPENP